MTKTSMIRSLVLIAADDVLKGEMNPPKAAASDFCRKLGSKTQFKKLSFACAPDVLQVKVFLLMKYMPALACAILVPALWFAQIEKMPWKEMTYAKDGFALTVPYPPLPQPDMHMPDTNAYVIYLPRDKNVDLTLRVVHQLRECNYTLARLRDSLSGKPTVDASSVRVHGVDISSIKDISINGHPGLEYHLQVSPSTIGLERYYCVDGQFYIFSATWPSGTRLPAVVARIIGSFRIVKTDSH